MDSNSQLSGRGRGALPAALPIGVFAPELQAVIDRAGLLFGTRSSGQSTNQDAVRVILTGSNYKVVLVIPDQLPGLQIISTSGVGYDA